MNNETVIRAFMLKTKAHTPTRNISNGIYLYKGQTLYTTGQILFNYNTIIAEWTNDNTITLNAKKYSVTTSKIQNKIREIAKEYNIEILEVK